MPARTRQLASPAIPSSPTPQPQIRLARRADLPAIVDLFNATIPGRTATAQLEPFTVEERVPWFEASTPHERPLWVAEDPAGEVVAWVGLSDFYIRAAYKPTAQVSIYLRDDQRGAGLGGRLLDHVIAEAPKAGVHALIGLVFAHNAPSLRLFESRGFERWGHMPRVANMDGVWRDLVHVGRHVS
ncbi:Putative phosphinothricin acetyltransferase YwnH [Paraconexibacter sp. AEG42_29]|uniref:Phosphinothricin acetyltransferase YwnH n=1 Tax=Paraconexibacter sp. AEG42_29 TaxID=2997339 RepID=A0AAU7AZC1_9ACTN